MADTSRRDLLTSAAGLAAGGVLALPAPAADLDPAGAPFRIAPSANYLEFRHLARLVAEVDRERGLGSTAITHGHPYIRLRSLLDEMTARPPQSPSDLLDYAAVMLWRHTSLYDGTQDPCEALNEAGDRATAQERAAYALAWAVFSLEADRTAPARRAEWKPPLRWDPDL